MNIKQKTSQNSILTYFLIIVGFVGIRALSALGLLSFLGEYVSYVFTIVVQIGLLFCLSVFMFSGLQKQKIKTTFKFYGYKKISPKALVITIALGVIVFFLNIFVAGFFDTILEALGYNFRQSEPLTSYPVYLLFVNIIFTAVLPAICEETAHRGLLLKGQSGLGQKQALIISSLLFGLLHLNIEQFFYATIIGFFLGYISIICDSIYPAMIIHFMNNALSVYSGFASFHKLTFAKILSLPYTFIQNNFFLGFLFIILLVILLIMSGYYLMKKLFMETAGKNMANVQMELYKELAKNDYINDIEQSKAELEGKKNVETKVNLQEIFIDKNIKLGLMTDLDRQLLSNKTQNKPSKIAIAIMVASFILTVGITIFTFVWGVI